MVLVIFMEVSIFIIYYKICKYGEQLKKISNILNSRKLSNILMQFLFRKITYE